ncbi:hypothetical protein [Actinospongicola halichondriae]|uniref:hypothetical protein n=1 Tax=Actinospongicola halichondriae TaxID=3236844 RepID=UPI003D4BCD0A
MIGRTTLDTGGNMSDEERNAGAGDGVSDPALASRLEMIHSSMSTMGMRIEALVTSTTTYRSALTDRLNEYADLVTKLTRSQATDIEEYRRANERTLTELRRGLSTSEETLERVGARIDTMLTDTESNDESSRRALAEVRSILEAQENLGRTLTESLDQFSDQVLSRLTASEQAAAQQLEALEAAVSQVGSTPDPTLSLVDDRLAGIEDRLAVVASNDTATALGNRFDTLHSALADLDSGLRAELGGAGKVATESFGELAGLRSKVDAMLETSATQSGAVTGTLEQLKETLQDLASGEVVGALWDEVRQVRATVEALVDRDATTTDPEAVQALQSEVSGLTASVRDLLEQAEVVDDQGVGSGDGVHLASLAADIAALREELADGLVVDLPAPEPRPSEPTPAPMSPEVEAEFRAVRSGVEDIIGRLDAEPEPSEPTPAPMSPEVEAELRAVRTGVEDIIVRLDEGLVLADDAGVPPADIAPEIADQVATLRDQVSAEFERLRQVVDAGGESVDLTPLTARLDRLHDDLADQQPMDETVPGEPVDLSPVLDALHEIQDGIVHLLDRPVVETVPVPAPAQPAATSDGYATVDPDVIDLLREEIRSVGSVSDELVETLGAELKALRRRIRLRAEGEIFSDDQLEMIADAVARKLGE